MSTSSVSNSATRKSRWSLAGMTVLVTGGTRGIGYAVVEELAELGAAVHTCSRNMAELNQRLQEWSARGYTVTGSVCDATSRSQREQLLENISSIFNGKLHILILYRLKPQNRQPKLPATMKINRKWNLPWNRYGIRLCFEETRMAAIVYVCDVYSRPSKGLG
nr:tropinone reductase homolog At5g06060-like [Tanacetum cinerariifolium]